MKQFLYCEATEGGMEEFVVVGEITELPLFGWMNKNCEMSDTKLVQWSKEASVGEYTDHRLGVMIRLKDTEK